MIRRSIQSWTEEQKSSSLARSSATNEESHLQKCSQGEEDPNVTFRIMKRSLFSKKKPEFPVQE